MRGMPSVIAPVGSITQGSPPPRTTASPCGAGRRRDARRSPDRSRCPRSGSRRAWKASSSRPSQSSPPRARVSSRSPNGRRRRPRGDGSWPRPGSSPRPRSQRACAPRGRRSTWLEARIRQPDPPAAPRSRLYPADSTAGPVSGRRSGRHRSARDAASPGSSAPDVIGRGDWK